MGKQGAAARRAAVMLALGLTAAAIGGCTGQGEPAGQPAPIRSSPSATAGSGTSATGAPVAPTAGPSAAPPTIAGTAPAASPSAPPPPVVAPAPTLGPGNEAKDVPAASDAAARFGACVTEYQRLEAVALPGPTLTTARVEQWSEGYRQASQAAAEQDYEQAAALCTAVVADMRSVLG